MSGNFVLSTCFTSAFLCSGCFCLCLRQSAPCRSRMPLQVATYFRENAEDPCPSRGLEWQSHCILAESADFMRLELRNSPRSCRANTNRGSSGDLLLAVGRGAAWTVWRPAELLILVPREIFFSRAIIGNEKDMKRILDIEIRESSVRAARESHVRSPKVFLLLIVNGAGARTHLKTNEKYYVLFASPSKPS